MSFLIEVLKYWLVASKTVTAIREQFLPLCLSLIVSKT